MKQALAKTRPNDFIAPALIALSFALLITGQLLPLVEVKQMIFWKSHYSVVTGVWELLTGGELFLGLLIFIFSILFPIVKLLLLGMIWFKPMVPEERERSLRWLGILGKWSMLDVFVVAVSVILVKAMPMIHIAPKAGVYVFSLAIFLSMAATGYIRKQGQSIRVIELSA